MLSLLLALALVFSLAACGSGSARAGRAHRGPGQEETAPVESLLGTQPVTITFWHCASGRGRRADGQVH